MFKMKLFKKGRRYNKRVISLPEFPSNTNPKWLIIAAFSKLSRVTVEGKHLISVQSEKNRFRMCVMCKALYWRHTILSPPGPRNVHLVYSKILKDRLLWDIPVVLRVWEAERGGDILVQRVVKWSLLRRIHSGIFAICTGWENLVTGEMAFVSPPNMNNTSPLTRG